ncbi:MAG: class I SAM-dependent methyltransferase [Phormidesmis sp.]
MSADSYPSARQTSTQQAAEANTQAYFETSEIWSETIEPYQQQVLNDIVAILPADVRTLLDLGCGNGLLTNQLPARLEVVGFDRSHQALKQVKTKTVQGDISQLPFADGAFDLVMCNDVLEHLPIATRQQALDEMTRVAAKYVIITVPFLENLNQGLTRCGRCDRFYHVNHHLSAFDLADSRQFLSGRSEQQASEFEDSDRSRWQCTRQVLTGDTWVSEPPVSVVLKRLNEVEWSVANAPLCPHCGSAEVADLRPQAARDALTMMYLQKNARLSVEQPELSDWCDRRTECITLFTKTSLTKTGVHPQSLPLQTLTQPTFMTAQGEAVQLPVSAIARHQIDFRKANCYRRGSLPNIARDPYFLSEGTTDNRGILLQPQQTLLAGFFAQLCEPAPPPFGPAQKTSENPGYSIELMITGQAKADAVIGVSDYRDDSSYQAAHRVAVSGMFSTGLRIDNVSLSRYGYLFQITVEQSSLHIVSLDIVNAVIDRRKTYNNCEGKARFMRMPRSDQAETPVDLSLPFYGDRIKEYAWIRQPGIISSKHQPTFALLQPASLPRWMQIILDSPPSSL